jgi:glycosyltransferase involved in cell wall biosynthesis
MQLGGQVKITWAGLISSEKIPEIDRSAHVLFSADLNAACPNAVIEALACGTPVVSFATGALPEMLEGGGGLTVPYGGDPWHLDPPDIQSLAQAALMIIQDQSLFRRAARQRAEQVFSLEHMVAAYQEVLLG